MPNAEPEIFDKTPKMRIARSERAIRGMELGGLEPPTSWVR
jgi:hypothetical protein